jgi:hypothetical protein
MGISVLPTRYRINGVLSTDATVMQNMETLARAAQSWFTYDVNAGRWAVIINREGTSIASFDDSNITGPVSISGTGLSDLYNRVRVEFPHVDLDDQVDFVEIAIPSEDRNANEPDNTLNISFDVINDPVMAEMLGLIELKQSRVDKVIRFTTDYSYIGLRAGDLIDVTNSVLGYTNKVFRIISIEEADDEAISISITATEYDANVYDTSDLFRFERSNANGIVTKGAIDPPTTPVIVAYEQSARPGVDLETTVPSGIVEKIEFWYSTDNTNFILVGTEAPSGGGTYAFGETVIFNYDKFDAAGNVYVKCRALNSTTTSEYSATASLIGFTPKQVTDAIGSDTEILDDNNNVIATQLGISLALAALDGFLGGNDDMNQVFDQQFDQQLAAAGVSTKAFVYDDLAAGSTVIIPDTFIQFVGTTAQGFFVRQNLGTFVAPSSGKHLLEVYLNYGTSTSQGGNTTSNWKFCLTTVSSVGYYTGSLGDSSSALGAVADDIVTAQNPAMYEINTSYNHINSDITFQQTGDLVAGQTYYVSAFLCLDAPTDIATKVITISKL